MDDRSNEKSIGKVMIAVTSKKNYGILSAFLTIGILLLALSYKQMIFGKYIFIRGDLFEQCIPFAKLYMDKLAEGSNMYYSFKAGLGMNTSLLFAFYVFSPFNVFYLFANGDNINSIAIVVFVLKAGMAAFSFQLFARYNLKVSSFVGVIFSIGYALASYGIAISEMTTLYDGVYLLPLILISIKYMVDRRKALWLILLYTILFVSNFYSGYVVGVASFCYFVIYIIYRNEKNDKNAIVFFRYGICLVCSFLLSSCILVPALYDAMKQNVIDSEYSFSVNSAWDIVTSFFPFRDFEMYSSIPYSYCGMPAILLCGAFFANKEIRKKYKLVGAVAVVIALLTMTNKYIYSVAHMFNDPTGFTYRYIYVLSLVVCSMGLIASNHLTGVEWKKTLIIDSLLLMVYCFSPLMNKMLGGHYNSQGFTNYIVSIILAVIWMFIFRLYWKNYIYEINEEKDNKSTFSMRDIAVLALIIIAFETCANSYVLLTREGYYSCEDYNYKMKQAEFLTDELKAYDNSIFRIHYDGLSNYNQSCLFDYYGSTLYASSGNEKVKDFLYKLGISKSVFFLQGKGTTDLTKVILNEKYDLGAYLFNNEYNENYIEENKVSGLGFMVSDATVNIDMTDDVFINQNNVYSALLGEEVIPFLNYSGEVLYEGENVQISINDDEKVVFGLIDGATIGSLCMEIPLSDGNDMYSWLTLGDNFINTMSPVVYSPEEYMDCEYIKPLLSAPQIMKMSRNGNGYVIYVYLASSTINESCIFDSRFAAYDDSYISELVDKLSSQTFLTSSFEDGYIDGSITVTEPGICFFSVPYEEGWSALVDGNNEEIVPLFNGTFVGVPLDKGNHEVRLIFEAPYSKLGQILSVLGIVLLCAIMLCEMKAKYREDSV